MKFKVLPWLSIVGLVLVAVLPKTLAGAGEPLQTFQNPLIEARSQELKHGSECADALAFRFRQGPVLGICGYAPSALDKAGEFHVEANDGLRIDVKDANGSVSTLLDVGGAVGNPYRVELIPGSGLRITEQLRDPVVPGAGQKQVLYSFLEQKIVCNQKTCELGPQTCALNLPKNLYPHVQEEIREAAKQYKAGTSGRSDAINDHITDLAYQLLLRAFAGDRQAADLLAHFPFELDGAYSEIVGTYQEEVEEAQKAGCHL